MASEPLPRIRLAGAGPVAMALALWMRREGLGPARIDWVRPQRPLPEAVAARAILHCTHTPVRDGEQLKQAIWQRETTRTTGIGHGIDGAGLALGGEFLRTAQAAVYSWSVDQGTVYSDFHGHTPEAGQGFFVRYIEHQDTTGGNGSLVAPFDGEHGWYWLNYNDFPVTVTLTVTGYYDDVLDYGIF